MYNRILVPVDLSNMEKAERTVGKAQSLLNDAGTIILLNVVEQLPAYLAIDVPMDIVDTAVRDAKDKLETLRQRSGKVGGVEIRSGAPAREILQFAEEMGADLVIIASHTPDFSNYFIGSTADRVVRHAKCSVLVER